MKFPDLAIGSRFEFQGDTYTKETPLVARDESTGQKKFMARSASVTPLADSSTAEPAPEPSHTETLLAADQVMHAFNAFYHRCQENLDALDADTGSVARAREDLEKARAQFMHSLSL